MKVIFQQDFYQDHTSDPASAAGRMEATNLREAYMHEIAYEMGHCGADIIGISAGFDNHEQDWGGTLRTDDYRIIGHGSGGCQAVRRGMFRYPGRGVQPSGSRSQCDGANRRIVRRMTLISLP